MKNTIFFLVGNFGVGKSSIIENPVKKSVDNILLEIDDNLYVLGKTIIGADSLSGIEKKEVRQILIKNKDKNVIIAGVYYVTLVDIEELKEHFRIVIVYLKTSFEENARRIAKRGSLINVETYNQKIKQHQAFLNKSKKKAKILFLNNDKSLDEVRYDFYSIIKKETNKYEKN